MKRVFILLTALLVIKTYGQSRLNGQQLSVDSRDGVSIAFEVHGEGLPSLEFVHGWSCDKSYWKNQLPFFVKKYTVVAFDLGEQGDSGLGIKDWTINSFGKDVAAVVNKLKLEKVILIGHSMGGDVIVDAAFQQPEIVTRFIMVDTYKKLGDGRSMEQIKAFVDELGADFSFNVQHLVHSLFLPYSDSSLKDFVAKDMSLAPRVVALSAIKFSFTHSRQITYDLQQLKLPIIAIDSDYEATNLESMKKYGVETIIMEGVGQFMMMEDSKRFNELFNTTIKVLIE